MKVHYGEDKNSHCHSQEVFPMRDRGREGVKFIYEMCRIAKNVSVDKSYPCL